MENQKQRLRAILEPNSERKFDAYLEEMPHISTSGKKIANIMDTLRKEAAQSLEIQPENIVLALSVRVKVDW